VLFTSNLGVREAMAETEDPEKQKEIILEEVKTHLRPELYNRISQVIPFNSLSESELQRIVETQLGRLRRKLSEDREIGLVVSPETLRHLCEQSYDPAYGARPVNRTLQRLVISPIATAVLAGDVAPGQVLHLDYDAAEGILLHVEAAAVAAG
jgi:ATP-dependent Clp protease ATP-binding subunit ClpB